MTDHSFIQTKSIAELAEYGIRRIAAALGVFDGVHLGHLDVLKELLKAAQETDSIPVVVTFSPHPRSVLSGFSAPVLLVSEEERFQLLREAGAEAVVVIPFDLRFASLEPEAFLDRLLREKNVKINAICVGSRWKFGAGAKGGTEILKKRAKQDGFLFRSIPEKELNGETVCSTAIRKAISSGDLTKARTMLGRSCELRGTVEHGLGLADKMLDSPTANLKCTSGILPPFGVYACFAILEDDPEKTLHPAVTNIGVAPTIRTEENPAPKIEVHFLDFSGNLYGRKMILRLISGIRREKKFDNPGQLRDRIRLDVELTREILQKELDSK